MKVTKDENGIMLDDQFRLTNFGKFIRNTSLDEVPCLINVFLGQMTLVGPRPFITKYRNLYTIEQFRRHDVVPGITGWAQINGRNSISWEQKFSLDLEYVDKQSFFFDLKILLLTIIKVMQRKDISAAGHVTIEEFKGVGK